MLHPWFITTFLAGNPNRRATRKHGHCFRPGVETLEPRMMLAVDVGLTVPGTTNYPNGGLRNVGETILSNANERSLYGGVLDPTTGYALFSTAAAINPARIVKVNLNGALPVEVGSTLTANGEINLISSVIDTSDPDPAKHYAYFGSTTQPGKIIKVKLGAGDTAPTYLGSLALKSAPALEGSVFGGVIDTTNADPAKHYAYFGVTSTTGSPARIVKVALGIGDALPTEVASISLAAGETSIRRAVIDTSDPLNHYAYFASSSGATSSFLVKVKLGEGTEFKRLGAAALAADEQPIGSAVLDVKNHYAYLGTYNSAQSQAKVVMVATGAGDAAPTRVGAISLQAGERELSTAVIDTASGYALFGSDHTHPAKVYKIKLASGGVLPTEAGVLQLQPGTTKYPVADGGNIVSADPVKYGEIYLQSSVIDTVRGYTYFGTDTAPAQIVKVANSEMGALHGMKIAISSTAVVDTLRFYSQAAAGNLRLAIYDNAATKHLVWQSQPIANTTANTWITASVAAGSVQLTAGTYWLAFQTDTTASVASYTPGAVGDGFTVEQSFGAFTPLLAASTANSERWSIYLSYHAPAAAGSAAASASLPAGAAFALLASSPANAASGGAVIVSPVSVGVSPSVATMVVSTAPPVAAIGVVSSSNAAASVTSTTSAPTNTTLDNGKLKALDAVLAAGL